MFGAVVKKSICLEKKISLITEELSCYILIFIVIKHIALIHCGQDGFDQVLKALINEALLLGLKLGRPLTHREVIFEVLFYFQLHKLLGFDDSFIHRIEKCHKHVDVGRSIQQFVLLIIIKILVLDKPRNKYAISHLFFKQFYIFYTL